MRGLTAQEFDRLVEIEDDVARGPCQEGTVDGYLHTDSVLSSLYQRKLVFDEPCPFHFSSHVSLTALGRLALHLARVLPETRT